MMSMRLTVHLRDPALLILAATLNASEGAAQHTDRSVRIQLTDSSSAVVHLASSDPSVMLYTPRGIFRLRADAPVLASWAEAVANLPRTVTKADSTRNAPPTLPGSVLRATDESGNAMRLLRLSGDSAWPYQLSASNGAWEYGERVSAEKASLLLLALGGRNAAGLKWENYAPTNETRDSGYRAATMAPDNPRPKYPSRAELRRFPGEVRVQFEVGSDGRVRPETLLLVRATHPLFALAVRDAIPSMRFAPATRNGLPIEDTVLQEFQFKAP